MGFRNHARTLLNPALISLVTNNEKRASRGFGIHGIVILHLAIPIIIDALSLC